MNKSLKTKIDEAIQNKTLCKNLLLISMASANHKKSTCKNDRALLETYLKTMATTAISHGVLKREIIDDLIAVHQRDYPSMDVIKSVVALCSSDHNYEEELIKDRLIKRKTQEEMQEKAAKATEVKSNKNCDNNAEDDPEGLAKLIEYVQKKHLGGMEFDKSKTDILRNMKSEKYNYEVILKAFQFAEHDLNRIKRSFNTGNDKLRYIRKIVMDKYLSEALYWFEERERAKERIKYLDISSHVNRVHRYTPVTKKTNGNWLKEMEKRKQELDDLVIDEDDEPPLDIDALMKEEGELKKNDSEIKPQTIPQRRSQAGSPKNHKVTHYVGAMKPYDYFTNEEEVAIRKDGLNMAIDGKSRDAIIAEWRQYFDRRLKAAVELLDATYDFHTGLKRDGLDGEYERIAQEIIIENN